MTDENKELSNNEIIVPETESAEDTAKADKPVRNRIKKEVKQYGLGLAASVLGGVLAYAKEAAEEKSSEMKDNGVGDRENVEAKDRIKAGVQKVGFGLADIVDDSIEEQDNILGGRIREYIGEKYGSNAADAADAMYKLFNGRMSAGIADKMREGMAASDDKRDKGLEVPDDVEIFADLIYGKDPAENLLDVYRPIRKLIANAGIAQTMASENVSAALPKMPVIVSFHGGTWIYGDKERYKFYCMSLAQRGFAVVNFTYRLAPEHKFPAALEDMNNVFAWMLAHSEEYGLDMDNVFMVGDSAGGNLGGLYLCILTNPDYAANFDFAPPAEARIRAAAFNCGVYDPLNFIQEKELMKGLILEEKSDVHDRLMNVSENMNSNFPPVFVMDCIGDFCFRYFEPMTKALTKNGVEHIGKVYGSEEEPLFHVFHLDIRNPIATICNDDECEFFRAHIS